MTPSPLSGQIPLKNMKVVCRRPLSFVCVARHAVRDKVHILETTSVFETRNSFPIRKLSVFRVFVKMEIVSELGSHYEVKLLYL